MLCGPPFSCDCQGEADALVSASAQCNWSVRGQPRAADILATQRAGGRMARPTKAGRG